MDTYSHLNPVSFRIKNWLLKLKAKFAYENETRINSFSKSKSKIAYWNLENILLKIHAFESVLIPPNWCFVVAYMTKP
jgi:hypothetical protein